MILGDLPLNEEDLWLHPSVVKEKDQKAQQKAQKCKKAQQARKAQRPRKVQQAPKAPKQALALKTQQAKKVQQAQKVRQVEKAQQVQSAHQAATTPQVQTVRQAEWAQQVQTPQQAPPIYYARPTVKLVETSLTDTTQFYLISVGSPNIRGSSSSLATFWSLLLIDTLRPEKATLHSLSVTTQHRPPIHRERSNFLYNGARPSLDRDVQMALPPAVEINLGKYVGKGKGKAVDSDTTEETSASALLDEVIRRQIPLTSLYPPPPPDSFDAFDDDYDFKRGIPSPDCIILSYCHIGTHSSIALKSLKFAQHCYDRGLGLQLTSEGFRLNLSNALGHILERSSSYYYSSLLSRPGYDIRDIETRLTHDWAVRAVNGVYGYFDLSSDMLSGRAIWESPKEGITNLLDAKTTQMKERKGEGVAMMNASN